MNSRYSFDVGSVLGIGTADASPLPDATDGEIVLRIAEGISLIGLRDSNVGKQLMHQQDWYGKYDWCRQVFPAGIYRLRVLLLGSYSKTFTEQQALLVEGEAVAPVTLAAVALLCMQRLGHPDPLANKWTLCAEPTATGYRAALIWGGARLLVSDVWDDYRISIVGVSVLRTS